MRRPLRSPLLLGLLALSLVSCAPPGATPHTGAAADENVLRPERAAPMSGVAPHSAGAVAPTADRIAAPAPAVAPVASSQQQQAAMRAGSVDDNADFEAYKRYKADYQAAPMRALDVSERYRLRVVGADGKAVANAEVVVKVGESEVFRGKTYANGQLLFHPRAVSGAEQAQSFSVSAQKGEHTATLTLSKAQQQGIVELKLTGSPTAGARKLDVLFLLDATGSMGGEIGRLQSTISAIGDRIHSLDGQPAVRFGLVSYRDHGDDYVTRETPFTSDVTGFKRALDAVRAEGGGDYPEHLESGLDAALTKLAWDSGDAVRLVFLVADAPPQLGYAQTVPYTRSLRRAVETGVKLFPVGTSGLSAEGEYVMRQLAQYTLGQYLFVTRGGDEATGGGAASATVDKYAEGRLDDIVVDIVKAELDSLGK